MDLQHLPDFKGIETLYCLQMKYLVFLQHLPDFKGIETPASPSTALAERLAAPP